MDGDFNIILDSDEAWGANHSGFIDDYFINLFASKNLIDIKPPKLVPTWRNERLGQNAITRRLDRVVVSEELLSKICHYRAWVEYPFFSDHAPIWFQLDLLSEHKTCPFKFNCHWLEDKAFVEIVKKVWNDPRSITENSALRKLVWKLQVLKQCTKIWLKEKTKKDKDKLVDLESDIKDLTTKFSG